MAQTNITSHCTNCGAKLHAQDRFCTKCGTVVKRDVKREIARLPLWIWGVGVLVLAAAAFLLLSAVHPPSPPATNVTDVHDAEGIPYPDVPRVSADEAKASWDTKSAVFVDVRGQTDYATGHIANAVSLPLAQIEAGDTTLPREAEILTYCT